MSPEYDGVISSEFASLLMRYGATPDLGRVDTSNHDMVRMDPTDPIQLTTRVWPRFLSRFQFLSANWPTVRATMGAVAGLGVFVGAFFYVPSPMMFTVSAYAATGEVLDNGSPPLQPFGIDGITGGSVELTPGYVAKLDVEISNPNTVTIVVERLSATLSQPITEGGAKVTDCPSGVLFIESITEKPRVSPRSSTTVPITVHVSDVVPKACAEAIFPVTLTGQATAEK